MTFNTDGARRRVIDAMRSGKWDVVDLELNAYAAAVRAEERHRAIGEALDVLSECAGRDGDGLVRDCLPLVERLR